ncbi:hypothetical protein H7X87_04220 [Acetobacteraceae bacterium]|nr:hypothetical protein [Candidatus Parcubacteria bacterium]
MLRIYKSFFAASLLLFFFIVPVFAFGAQDDVYFGGGANNNASAGSGAQRDVGIGTSLNPLKGASDFCELALALYNLGFAFFIPIAALAFVYSGFRFVEARGNPDKLQKAKKQFAYIFIGIFVIFFAWVLIVAATNVIISLGADNSFNTCLRY